MNYESAGTGTDWTQTNTLELKFGSLGRLTAPIVTWSLRRSMRQSMAKAKSIMESAPT